MVRVDESPEAPHAIEHGTRIYVRTEDVNSKFDLAEIGRLEHLLNRRKKIEDDRHELLATALKRARTLLREQDPHPVLWAAVMPLYPWRELCALRSA